MGIIEKANALTLPEFIESFVQDDSLSSTFEHPANGNIYTISLETGASLAARDFQSCFDLIKSTSCSSYRSSSTGWSATKKRREMKLPDLRYVLIKTSGAPIDSSDEKTGQEAVVAFLSFMLTYEDGHEVVYCYEIHLAPELRGVGLGKKLMERMESIGQVVGVEKAMLTVFLDNEAGLRFYDKLG